MPSSKKPLTTVQSSAGKLHADIATASAQIFPDGGGQEALLTFLNNAAQREVIAVHQSGPLVAVGQTSFDLRTITFDSIWLGDLASGPTHPLGATPIEDLFQITDGAGNVFKELGTVPVEIVSVTGPTIGDGFVANPVAVQVNFNVALPSSGTFRLWWGARSQVATVEKDLASFTNVRQQRLVEPLALITRLEELHAAPGREQAWNDPWDSTIEALAAAGLNERYRRSTVIPPEVAATGTLLYSLGGASNGTTVTIDGKVYSYQTVLTDVDGNVALGASQAEQVANLRRAINLDGVAGVNYASSTTLHPSVSATDNAANAVLLTATSPLPADGGNFIPTINSLGFPNLVFSTGPTLNGGSGYTLDDEGNGAVIFRDGRAPTVETDSERNVDYFNGMPDPFSANWLSQTRGVDKSGSWPGVARDGGLGFVSIGQVRFTTSISERSFPAQSAGAHYNGMLRNIAVGSIGGASVRSAMPVTYVGGVLPPVTNTAILNPDAGVTEDDRRTIEATFFGNTVINAGGNTEISVGYDLVRIRYRESLQNRPDEVYVVTGILGIDRVQVRTLTGAPAGFPSGSSVTDCTIQLIKTTFHHGGGAGPANAVHFGHADPVGLSTSLYHAAQPSITDDPATAGEEFVPKAARFLAASRTATEYSHTGSPVPHALEWGGFDPTIAVAQTFPGKLRGDGGVDATIFKQGYRKVTVSVAGTTTWHPGLEGSLLHVEFTHAAGTIAWTLALDPDYDPVNGEKLEVMLQAPTNAPLGGTAEVTITWPSGPPRTFIFDAFSQVNALHIGHFTWLEATHLTTGGGIFLVSAKRYENPVVAAKSLRTVAANPPITAASLGGGLTWRPMVEGGYLEIEFTDSGAYTLTLTDEGAAWPLAGAHIWVEILQTAGTGATLVWPGDFTFSGADATIPAGAGDRALYHGIYSLSGGDWLMTRTDY